VYSYTYLLISNIVVMVAE